MQKKKKVCSFSNIDKRDAEKQRENQKGREEEEEEEKFTLLFTSCERANIYKRDIKKYRKKRRIRSSFNFLQKLKYK